MAGTTGPGESHEITGSSALERFQDSLAWAFPQAEDGDDARWPRIAGVAGDDERALRSRRFWEAGTRTFASAPDDGPVSTVDLLRICEWIDLSVVAGLALGEAERWVAYWLTAAEEWVGAVRPEHANTTPLLTDMALADPHVRTTCVQGSDMAGGLSERFETLWERWASAFGRHPTLRTILAVRDNAREDAWSYDRLLHEAGRLDSELNVGVDLIVECVLGGRPLPFGPSDDSEWRGGRHGYAHSPPKHIAAAIRILSLEPGDRFYDLGAGLGLPCFVAALSSQAICTGIEYHPGYAMRARDTARQLGMPPEMFVVHDATTFDWTNGNRFYMFNPFPPDVLEGLTSRLLRLARTRPIRVACLHTRLPDEFRLIGVDGPVSVYEAGAKTHIRPGKF